MFYIPRSFIRSFFPLVLIVAFLSILTWLGLQTVSTVVARQRFSSVSSFLGGVEASYTYTPFEAVSYSAHFPSGSIAKKIFLDGETYTERVEISSAHTAVLTDYIESLGTPHGVDKSVPSEIPFYTFVLEEAVTTGYSTYQDGKQTTYYCLEAICDATLLRLYSMLRVMWEDMR